MITEKRLWAVLFLTVALALTIFFVVIFGPAWLRAQTTEATVAAAKGKVLSIGSAQFRGPVVMDGKQVVTDDDFKTVQGKARVDSAAVVSTYKIVPLSSCKAAPKSLIEKIW